VQLCCRAQGGHNAGHTIVKNDKTFDVHILREYLPFNVIDAMLTHWTCSIRRSHGGMRQSHRHWMRGIRSWILQRD
jgi:hypothetical protein